MTAVRVCCRDRVADNRVTHKVDVELLAIDLDIWLEVILVRAPLIEVLTVCIRLVGNLHCGIAYLYIYIHARITHQRCRRGLYITERHISIYCTLLVVAGNNDNDVLRVRHYAHLRVRGVHPVELLCSVVRVGCRVKCKTCRACSVEDQIADVCIHIASLESALTLRTHTLVERVVEVCQRIYIESVRLYSLSRTNCKHEVTVLNLCNLDACTVICSLHLVLVRHNRSRYTRIDIYRSLCRLLRVWLVRVRIVRSVRIIRIWSVGIIRSVRVVRSVRLLLSRIVCRCILSTRYCNVHNYERTQHNCQKLLNHSTKY